MIAVAACASTLMTMVAASPARAAAGTPRLFAQYSEITLHRRNNGPVFLNAGVFVTAVGGDLEFHVGRDDGYLSPVTASQWADGAKVQDLDPSLVDGWQGLAGFLHVQIKNQAGNVIEDRDMTWCPGGYGMQRVDDSGPDIQRLPQFGCYMMPFTLGTVWGIDEGWGAPVSDRYGSSEPVYISGRDGDYHVTYSFPRAVAETFGIPREDRSAKVTVHVVTTKSGHTAARAPAAPTGDAAPRVPTDLNPDPSTVPDLIPLPAFGMDVYHRRGGGDFLAFGANIWSAGPSPMVVEGFRRQQLRRDGRVRVLLRRRHAGQPRAGRHVRVRRPQGPSPLAHGAVRALLPAERRPDRDRAVDEAVVLPGADRPDRPAAADGRVVPVVVRRRRPEHRLRRQRRDLDPRGPPGRLGRHLLTSTWPDSPSTSPTCRTAVTTCRSRPTRRDR